MMSTPLSMKNSRSLTPQQKPPVRPRTPQVEIPDVLTSCAHVLPGAVWCDLCAQSALTQARQMYQTVMKNSRNVHVQVVARERLTEAVRMFSLSSAGLASLNRQYLDHAAAGRSVDAQQVYEKMMSATREANRVNQVAHENTRKRSAQRTTAYSTEHGVFPAKDRSGRYTTAGSTLVMTTHASQRQIMRSISADEIAEAFREFSVVSTSQIFGVNGVVLCGKFMSVLGSKEFLVRTVYRSGVLDEN